MGSIRSPAAALKELSLGVTPSGMGSDGKSGMRALLERAGVATVPAPTDDGVD